MTVVHAVFVLVGMHFEKRKMTKFSGFNFFLLHTDWPAAAAVVAVAAILFSVQPKMKDDRPAMCGVVFQLRIVWLVFFD